MPAAKSDILIEQGSTFTRVVSVTNESATGNSAFDLTGYTIRSQMRSSYGATAYYTFSCTYANGPTYGMFTMSMGATATAAIPASDSKYYVYDVELAAGSPETVIRILEGRVTVTPEVTR